MKKFLKILKYSVMAMLGITLALVIFLQLSARRLEFSFANEGKIICVTQKAWGLFDRGDLNCFGVHPLNSGLDQLLQTVNTLDEKGEIILRKP